MDWIACLVALGGSIYLFLGVAHNVMSLADVRNPSKIVPDDPSLIEAMQGSTVRLTRGQTTVWTAWLGFNLSHGLGLIVFGLVALGAAWWFAGSLGSPLLVGFVVLSSFYLLLSVRFFFRSPVIATALATALFLAALIADRLLG